MTEPLADRSTFASRVAHYLGNELTPLRGFADLAFEDLRAAAQGLETFSAVLAAAAPPLAETLAPVLDPIRTAAPKPKPCKRCSACERALFHRWRRRVEDYRLCVIGRDRIPTPERVESLGGEIRKSIRERCPGMIRDVLRDVAARLSCVHDDLGNGALAVAQASLHDAAINLEELASEETRNLRLNPSERCAARIAAARRRRAREGT